MFMLFHVVLYHSIFKLSYCAYPTLFPTVVRLRDSGSDRLGASVTSPAKHPEEEDRAAQKAAHSSHRRSITMEANVLMEWKD